MKRIVNVLLVAVMSLTLVFASVGGAYAAAKITLSSGAAAPSKIYVGHTYKLKVAGQKVKWASSNKNIATIGVTTGKLSGKAKGTVKITATNPKTGKTVASKSIKVLERAKSVSVDMEEIILENIGDTFIIKAKKDPASSTDVIRFISTDKTVATVGNISGKVTAVKAGTTIIKVYAKATADTANSNKSNIVATVTVTVLNDKENVLKSVEVVDNYHVKAQFDGLNEKTLKLTSFTLGTGNLTGTNDIGVNSFEVLKDGSLNLAFIKPLEGGKTYTLGYGKKNVTFIFNEIKSLYVNPKEIEVSINGKTTCYWVEVAALDYNGNKLSDQKITCTQIDSTPSGIEISTLSLAPNHFGFDATKAKVGKYVYRFDCDNFSEILIVNVVEGNHDWLATSASATCTEAGKTTYICKICGEEKEEIMSPLGHKWEECTVISPVGEKSAHKCSRCGLEEDHTSDYSNVAGVGLPTSAKCTKCGYTLQ